MIDIALGSSLFITSFFGSAFTEKLKTTLEVDGTITKMEILDEFIQKEWLALPAEKNYHISVYDLSGAQIIDKKQNKLSNKEKSIMRKSDFLTNSADEKIFYLDK